MIYLAGFFTNSYGGSSTCRVLAAVREVVKLQRELVDI
jgi:hypothetical protein